MLATSRLAHLGVAGPFSSHGMYRYYNHSYLILDDFPLWIHTVLLLHISVRKSLQTTSMIHCQIKVIAPVLFRMIFFIGSLLIFLCLFSCSGCDRYGQHYTDISG